MSVLRPFVAFDGELRQQIGIGLKSPENVARKGSELQPSELRRRKIAENFDPH